MINKNEVLRWANERGLLKPENQLQQMGKMVSEVGELCDAIIEDDKNGQIDGIGDVLVTLIILANQLGYDIEDCLEVAYNEIKNRKGETINGTFIKE